MADDELERLRRQYESLQREYGELLVTQTRHDERIDRGSEERGEIRDAMEKMELELLAAIGRSEKRQRDLVTSVKESCDRGWEQYRKDREEALKRSDRNKASSRMIVVAVIAGSATVLAAIVAAAATIISGGG